jgi:peptidylprolyl isomerase
MTSMTRRLAAALPIALISGAASPAPAPAPVTPGTIVAKAVAADWAAVPAEDLLLLDLSNGRRVVIALAPAFAPVHIANIRTLTRAGWFAGISINRVQDNYVTQWGDATEKKPLPAGIVAQPPAEYDRPTRGIAFAALPYRDAYAAQAGHVAGWPAASDGSRVWLTHCYGMVGVGRNMAPDTGTGAELYTVIGHAPRHLDRNIATVGRVLAGMDALSALARGDETNMGFYKEDAARPVIAGARIAADLPAAERPRFELLRTDRPIFAAWVKARANRQDDFFVRPAGGVDICNVTPPVREVAKG